MITTGAKHFFGLALLALVAAFVYGGATAGHQVGMETFVGVLTLGYKGSVGDQVGYSIFMGLAAVSLFLGLVAVAFRDADPEAQAQAVGTAEIPEAPQPEGAAPGPVLAGFGAALLAVGVVAGAWLVIAGAAVLVVAVLEWSTRAWSERATGDPQVNLAVRARVMYPIELPILSVVVVAGFVVAVSRVLVALPKGGSYAVFGIVPVLILGVGLLIASREHLNRNLVAALLVVAALVVLGGGIAAAISGPRKTAERSGEEGGLRAVRPGAPVVARAPR
ncbi:MAG: hypothetical protein HYX34_00825 [Actinobacteria bacterium]|nr:hypothetical protein [Actinomycetota bacterium]